MENQSIEQHSISIHSLVKRETNAYASRDFTVLDFNPLPRKEGDGCYITAKDGDTISIHSLVKRETPCLSKRSMLE